MTTLCNFFVQHLSKRIMDWNVSLWKIFILVRIQGLIGSNRFSCFENMRNFAVIGCPNKNLVKSAAPVSQILFISPVL
jgi:hypothetical protein